MTLLHFLSCAALAFGPHAVYYKATPLSEYGTWGASLKAAAVYAATTLLKLILWATFLTVSDDSSGADARTFNPQQELLKAAISFADLAGLYYALTKVTHRNISFDHKFQAVGLGWALADALVHHVAPLVASVRGLEFTWDQVLDSMETTPSLILTLSLAALASLVWLRKNKPPLVLPLIYMTIGLIGVQPLLMSFVQQELRWSHTRAVTIELLLAILAALLTTRLYYASQPPQVRTSRR
eukprot:SM000296S11303  [mRNA]  locus=s296:37848:40797:- [translate_table: standard]